MSSNFNPARLGIARRRRRMTSKALADAVGVSPVTITRHETGQNEPEPETVRAFARALDFPEKFFFGDTIDDLPKEAASFRSLTAMSAKEREAALAAGSMAFVVCDWIEQRFNLPVAGHDRRVFCTRSRIGRTIASSGVGPWRAADPEHDQTAGVARRTCVFACREYEERRRLLVLAWRDTVHFSKHFQVAGTQSFRLRARAWSSCAAQARRAATGSGCRARGERFRFQFFDAGRRCSRTRAAAYFSRWHRRGEKAVASVRYSLGLSPFTN